MSFVDAESPFTLRRIAIGFGGVLLMLIVTAGIRYGAGDGTNQLLRNILQRQTTVEQVEAELERNVHTRGMISAFRTHYPAEYAEFMQRIVTAANRQGQQAAMAESFRFMQAFARAKVEHMASAPAPDLNNLGNALLTLSSSLRQTDVGLCARFHSIGLGPTDRMPESLVPALMQVNVQQFRAARHGEDGKRTPREISDADAAAWQARLAMIDPLAAELVAENRLERATPQQQCDSGLAIYQAAMDLPPEQSANVIAEFLRASMSPAA